MSSSVMSKGRLEAFSDGMFSILLTILVLELKVPAESDLSALRPLLPKFAAYVVSFAYLGIYWNNHHHMLHLMTRINGQILWANLHMLFWLSLFPFTTAWLGEHYDAPLPAAVYAFNLFMAGMGFWILQARIIADQGHGSKLAAAVGAGIKEKTSTVLYLVAMPFAWVQHWVSDAIFFIVALIWLVPDRRIEKPTVPSAKEHP